jgi:hypothetical protein
MKRPFPPAPGAPPGEQKKMSAIVQEMAEWALRPPVFARSRAAAEAALSLASLAWNVAIGDASPRAGIARSAGPRAALPPIPWAELRADNTDQLLALLVEYKKKNYPDDFRRIASTELRPDGNVRVLWAEGSKPVGASAAPAPASAARPASGALASQVRRRQPIADTLVKSIKRYTQGKVVDLRAAIAGRENAEHLLQNIVANEDLGQLHPAHAVHVHVHNLFSTLSEQLSGLDEMKPLVDLVSAAEDEYMPGAPPMSPLTTSYFNCWALFDASTEPGGETIGSVALAIASASGMHDEWLRIMGQQQRSRMGVHLHQGTDQNAVLLRELVTGRLCRAIPASGYRGKPGEIWYARLLPPPLPGMSEHVVFTTPYVLLGAVEHEWQSHFRRTLPDTPQQARLDAYEQYMKYGPACHYWHEFVLEAYVNFQSDVIFLTGLPDIAESRPHSSVYRGLGG